MHVSNHGADVTHPVLLPGLALAGAHVLEVILELGGPLGAVTLVAGVDLAPGRHLDVGVREHKLAEGGVEGEPVDAIARGDHEDGASTVHAVASRHLLVSGQKGELLLVLGTLVDAEDGANRDSSIDVGRTVKRVEHRSVVSSSAPLNADGGVLLFRSEVSHATSLPKLVLEHVVGQDVKLLLLLPLHVLASSSKPRHILDARLGNHVRDGAASSLDAAKDVLEVRIRRVLEGLLAHEIGEGQGEPVLLRVNPNDLVDRLCGSRSTLKAQGRA
mmetsp:Transcript_54632/g.111548  ORF Transcript_54632/g.111548 Transcript_54632/m.111548 type:complete len:273 (+) Transcript_54632:488-1306(+)